MFATGYGIIVTSSAVLCRDNEPFMIFSGGMARGSYGDKFTVSVIQGEKHVTFDFTSRVLDYTVLCKADEEPTDPGELSPHTFVPLPLHQVTVSVVEHLEFFVTQSIWFLLFF